MSLPAEIQVLVVGAGPTGLVSAIALAKLGLQVIIVDSSPTNPNGCRATVVHAHTLEVLEKMGLAQPLIDIGIKSEGVIFRGTTEKVVEFDFKLLRGYTDYPFSLLIAQEVVERIFRQRADSDGVQLVRNKTVTGLRQADRDQGVDVSFEDGSVIRAQYVVGADGSRSTIRHLMGVDFKDPVTGVPYADAIAATELRAVLADVYLEEPIPESVPRDKLSGYFTKFLIMIPLRSPSDTVTKSMSFWRIIYGFSPDEPMPPKNLSLEYLQQQMDERNPWDTRITIASVTAGSRYQIRDAVASNYVQKLGDGCVLLVGDAAHVHSPVGGQGMNLGICDAISVAHAIHSHKNAKDSVQKDVVLQNYTDTRRKIAIRVVKLTKRMRLSGATWWQLTIRKLILRLVPYIPFLGRQMVWTVSGLANRDG